ncbi:helix-turn-helix domain-containing protein [Actinacidiphila acidipaludis]|uniref:DUF2690 domain-containing protein n=1 Tax=Actinacidiphila acidipaludis TaxID=2873382 RepID=A0ABS7QHB6_9ACTN|nr:DUF2690 domain-containing protein [Streptomyces acidipaludis]MBY8882563.1 DUF2690 domain-containing protein [Streptomyces acidipaludis]
MGRWQPLRGDLPAEVARLVRELRQYVDRCEMNTTSLAAKTGYSRSSWLRYLNGRRLPPWPAAAALGRLAQADAEHLRVLWESAAHARTADDVRSAGRGPLTVPRPPSQTSGATSAAPHVLPAADDRTAPEAPDFPRTPRSRELPGSPSAPGAVAPSDETRPFSPRPRLPRGRSGTLTAVAAVSCLLAAVLLAQPWQDGTRTDRPAGAPAGAQPWPWALPDAAAQAATACRSAGCRGLDPYREGCDRGSVVVHRLRAYGRVLELEYSPVCQASWAEVDTPSATTVLRIATTGGDEQTAAAGGAYTTMVGSGPEAARATVVVDGHQLGVARYDSWIDAVTGSG